MKTALLLLLLSAGISNLSTESLSFSEGRAHSAEKKAPLLVLVHGSDWHSNGERLFTLVWQDDEFVKSLGDGVVLADVDILQTTDEAVRAANDGRNAGWVKKGSGLQTHPAILAYGPDGVLIGTLQGHELPKDIAAAQQAMLTFEARIQLWTELSRAILLAHDAADSQVELQCIIDRAELGLEPSKSLLKDIQRLDPTDGGGHHARLSFPHWNTLVKQATAEAQKGEGAAAEKRLQGMLANPAYTTTQRSAIYLALGSVYRRWEGHESQASVSFQAAWSVDPRAICGQAGRRLYLNLYAAPSRAFGWSKRHPATPNTTWVIADCPERLGPGRYILRLERTKFREVTFSGAQLMSGAAITAYLPNRHTLNKANPACEFEFTLSESKSDVSLLVFVEGGDEGSGKITWTELTGQ